MKGPQTAFSDQLHAEKYRGEGETFRDACYRLASALSDGDDHYRAVADILLDLRFMPAGRVQAAIGMTRHVTPYNCFVSGTIEDSMVEGHGSIMQRLTEAVATMRMGGGIGYDFSTLRPANDIIKSQRTPASGPVSFMSMFDSACRTIMSAGFRRGAMMSVLRIDHPDVMKFIHAKHPPDHMRVLWQEIDKIEDPAILQRAKRSLQETLPLSAFNVSLAVTDAFMESLGAGEPFPLRFNGEVYRTVDPRHLWEMVMRSTWDWAEPGVLFVDTINRMNNLAYCEEIAATNPCGEQPLPPYGACLLGSFNLVKYLRRQDGREGYTFDMPQLLRDIPVVVRAMDNVIDQARYPIFEQEKEAKQKRRMGLGVTGLANALEACGHPYGATDFCSQESWVLHALTRECYLASIDLAREKGSFPLFDRDKYCGGEFIRTLDVAVREGIERHGIRNSHLTSIAPTGTISLAADNVSSGIEPVFAYSAERKVRGPAGMQTETVEDYGARFLGVRGKRTADVTVGEHLAVLATAYAHVDSAVSKTLNVSDDVGWEDFKRVYRDAWNAGCKGCTTFRVDGKRMGILSATEDDVAPSSDDIVGPVTDACEIDPQSGRRDCD